MICRVGTLFRLSLCYAAVVAAAICVAPAASLAQHVAVVVNGEPITELDIANRSKLIQLTTRKAPSRQEVINDLIDDKIKINFARRYRLEANDSDVDQAFADVAQRMRQNGEGLSRILTAQGVAPYTLKDRLRAEIVWQQVVRGKYQASLQVTDKEVASALESRKKDDKPNTGFEYTLRPILFVVARNSGDGALEARKRDAETLKARWDNCDTGIPFARGLRDVVVRAPVTKSSAELGPALLEILDKTPIGKLTDPEVTQQGVEIFALCNKKEVSLDDAAKKRIQTEKFSEQFQAQSAKLLKSLRTGAMIEYKNPAKDGQRADPPPRNQPHASRSSDNTR